jgi:hypothetical protein
MKQGCYLLNCSMQEFDFVMQCFKILELNSVVEGRNLRMRNFVLYGLFLAFSGLQWIEHTTWIQ